MSGWRRFVAGMPLRTALLATAAVWVMGCVWSFREQTLFAQAEGFHIPWLLPAVIDGLAIALACVAYAASLDGRPGVVARLGTGVAVAASAASNAAFAWQRSGDVTAVVIAAGVPVAANLAFEVLLHELRRQVLRRRGLPAPAAVPYPRLIRVVLAPWSTLRDWRHLVLDLTAPTASLARPVAHAALTPTHPGPVLARVADAPTPDASQAPAPSAPAGAAAVSDAPATEDAQVAPAGAASAPAVAAKGRPAHNAHPEELRLRAFALMAGGASARAAAHDVGVPARTVQKWRREHDGASGDASAPARINGHDVAAALS